MKMLNQIMFAVITASAALSANAAHVLIVLSDEDQLELKNNHVFKTGFYLNELMQPTKMLFRCGAHRNVCHPKRESSNVR